MFFISQLDKQDCAFACLKMMLANFHNDKNYLYLPSEEGKSYSFQEIVEIAKEYCLELQGVRVSGVDELFNCKKYPFIASLQKKRGERHSVLVLKANRKHVTVFDPSTGKRKINTELFLNEWNLKAVIFQSVTKTKCPIVFPDFIAKKDKIILPILQILSGISLLVGTYFVSDKVQFYLPIIFFSVFVIFELLFRNALVNAMKRMDENVYEHKFKINESRTYPNLYETIERYRHIAFTINSNFIYSSLIVLFATIILMMNDLYNAVYVVLPLALAAIDVFLYKPYYSEQEVELAEKEKDIAEAKNDFEFKMKSNEIHGGAYKLAMNQNIYKYLEIAIIVLSIILLMVLTSTINITYVIFYLCICLFLKDNYEKLIEYPKQSDEFDFFRAKLLSSMTLKK